MDNAKKKRIKRYISWICIAALVLGLAVMPLLAKREAEADGPVASILSATAETGSIRTTLHSGGNLAADGAENVTIPTGVKITEFLVKNGDLVTEGTPLAVVDKVSVMTAITGVTETLEFLQDEITAARDETIPSTVKATAGGRVKKVFAKAGESVQEVMLRDGALAVLSLDGLMAVKIERSLPVSTGESVVVTLADDTEVTGRVESNLDGVVIITVDDQGYTIGETVTVATEDGQRMGTGQLYIHNAWKATAFSGTISTVSAKEEKTVSSGATLFTLTDTDYMGQLEYRANQHREYEELLQELFQMYESGTINAPCDGVVSGVDQDSAHLLAAEGQWEVNLLGSTVTVVPCPQVPILLSGGSDGGSTDNVDPACTKKADCPVQERDRHYPDCIKSCDSAATDGGCDATGAHYANCIKSCDHADRAENCNATGKHYADCIKGCENSKTEGNCGSGKHYLTCIESCISSDGTKDCPATGTHKASCIETCVHADVENVCEANKHHYTDCIESCVVSTGASVICNAGKHKTNCYFYGMTYKATAAKIYAVGTQLLVYTDLSGTVYDVVRSGTGWAVANGGKVNTDTLIGPETPVAAANPAAFKGKEGAIILLVTGYKGSETVDIGPVMYQAVSSGGAGFPSGLGGMSISGMIGGFSGYGNYSFGATTQGQEEELYDLEGSTLMTVTPEDTMILTITVDEKDIAKVALGQQATVKVEALRGETFDAEVTAIAISGTNNGGSSKFAVELTLDMSSDMLSGMSATASLPLVTRENVLTIPLAALAQEGARTVVYTARNEKTGEPANPVAVETGLSDAETVEILSGLSQGDTVYYSYYDVLELDTSAEAQKYSFG